MARVPDYTPFDHLRAGQAVGQAVGRILPDATKAFVGGVRAQQEIEESELKSTAMKAKILEAHRSKKAFKQEKQNLIGEWRGVLKKAPNEWVEKQIKYLESASTAEQLAERNRNLSRMLETNQNASKKYPYLSLQNPDPAGAGSILGPKAADDYEKNINEVTQTSNRRYIDNMVKNIITSEPGITEEEAVNRFATQSGIDGASLDEEARSQIKMAFVSEKERASMDVAKQKADMEKSKSSKSQNVVTIQGLMNNRKEIAALTDDFLRESNVDLRNVDDMGQFMDSEEWKRLSAEKQKKLAPKLERFHLAKVEEGAFLAARELGIPLDAAQATNVVKDIMDDGKPSTALAEQIADQMREQGFELPGAKDEEEPKEDLAIFKPEEGSFLSDIQKSNQKTSSITDDEEWLKSIGK